MAISNPGSNDNTKGRINKSKRPTRKTEGRMIDKAIICDICVLTSNY